MASITASRLRTVTTQGFIDRLTILLKTSQISNKAVQCHRTYPNPIKFYQNKLLCTQISIQTIYYASTQCQRFFLDSVSSILQRHFMLAILLIHLQWPVSYPEILCYSFFGAKLNYCFSIGDRSCSLSRFW